MKHQYIYLRQGLCSHEVHSFMEYKKEVYTIKSSYLGYIGLHRIYYYN